MSKGSFATDLHGFSRITQGPFASVGWRSEALTSGGLRSDALGTLWPRSRAQATKCIHGAWNWPGRGDSGKTPWKGDRGNRSMEVTVEERPFEDRVRRLESVGLQPLWSLLALG